MATLDFSDIERQAAGHPLWAQRGHAIQAYATLEQALCSLMAQFGNMAPRTAGTIFFRISNTRTRLRIVEELMKASVGNPYPDFWKQVQSLVGGLDGQRNEIVHWHTVQGVHVTEKGGTLTGLTLAPPNFWAQSPAAHTVETMKDFVQKCAFTSSLLNMYGSLLAGHLSGDAEKTWRGIFLQPVVYPPPSNHPLFRS
ncbi:hypothetical protein [Reyranella sp.]|uniref:hypothetical protein n=1 Tax=Reyranella sp. TaxID=1929291 RepID=UPI003C7B3D8F